MPNDTKDRRDLTPEELAAKEERFRSFFSTTAVNLPEEMTRRDSDLPEEKQKRKFGLFGRGREKTPEKEETKPLEMPTGEVLLGADAEPEEETDLELVLKPTAPQPAQELPPKTVPEAGAMKKSLPEPPLHQPEPPLKNPKNAPEILLPQEQQEQQEMARLKAMINDMSGVKPEKKPAAKKEPPKQEAAKLGAVFAAARETPAEAAEKAAAPAAAPQAAKPDPEPPVKTKAPAFFGTPEDEKKPEAPAAPAG